jgi:Cu/Ag efflux protein CusF
MRISRTLKRVITGFIGSCAVFSGLNAPMGSHLNLDVAAVAPVTALLQNFLTPAPAMAQSAVQGRGKVISVVAEKQELVLEHGEIKGFMDAMTMGYKVSSPSLLKGLKAGDQVNFTIDKNKSVITKITKLKN